MAIWGKFYFFLVFAAGAVAVEVTVFASSTSATTGISVGAPASYVTYATLRHPQYLLLCIVDQFVGRLVRTSLSASDNLLASRTILSYPRSSRMILNNPWSYRTISK